jgi:hypothetical protein
MERAHALPFRAVKVKALFRLKTLVPDKLLGQHVLKPTRNRNLIPAIYIYSVNEIVYERIYDAAFYFPGIFI